MILSDMQIAIIGGGIGGMAAATALALKGAQVSVFEQAPELEEVGAGLQISANGQKVLRALGADAQNHAYISAGTQMCDGHSGRRIATVPQPVSGPTWYLHRADLLRSLVRAAESAGVRIVLGQMRTPGTIDTDLIVAADGGQSLWRTEVDGPDKARFTGQVAWRALIPRTAHSDMSSPATVSMGSRAHVVSYPLRHGTLMNIVAIEERSSWTQEGWHHEADVTAFKDRFSDFRGPEKDWIARTSQAHVWALHTRPVARRWHKDGVVLLGDAAHPTLPFMAQGACLALEDAWVLAEALVTSERREQALELYQSLRRARAERVVALARANAWRFHLARPWAWGAHLALSVASGALARRLEWVYAYDATTVVR